jgi:long-chain acyl-CoA synthetase
VLVLQSGHNVAPEPLEAALRLAIAEVEPTLTDAQVVVLGHGRPHAVALVGPSGEDRVPEATVEAALARLNPTLSPKSKLHRFALLPEAMTAENGLLTPNLKLRRKEIASRFAETIEPLYTREPAKV